VTVTAKSSNGKGINDAEFSGAATHFTRDPNSKDGEYIVYYTTIGAVEVKAPGYAMATFEIIPFMTDKSVELNPSGGGGA
jgi:hypothetical protein